jgi:hypothetical protein
MHKTAQSLYDSHPVTVRRLREAHGHTTRLIQAGFANGKRVSLTDPEYAKWSEIEQRMADRLYFKAIKLPLAEVKKFIALFPPCVERAFLADWVRQQEKKAAEAADDQEIKRLEEALWDSPTGAPE